MTEGKGPSRIARFGRYAARRITGPLAGLPGHRALREACRCTADAIRPTRLERGDLMRGYRGRHADGGGARFRAMAVQAGLDEAALDHLAARRSQHARAAGAAAAALLIAGVALPFVAQDRVVALAGLGFGPFVLALLATALRSDYAAWQIERRRFGGFAEYAGRRWSGGCTRASKLSEVDLDDDCGFVRESDHAPAPTGEDEVPAQPRETEPEAGESALAKDVARRRKRLARAKERWVSDCDPVHDAYPFPAICYDTSAPRPCESSQSDADGQGARQRRAARVRRDRGAESDQSRAKADPEDRPGALCCGRPLIWMACAAAPLALAAAMPLLESSAASVLQESRVGSVLRGSGVASGLPALDSDAALALVGGTALCLAAAVLLAMALRCDFVAWQIGQRRFASLVEYVKVRWMGWNRRATGARSSGYGARGPLRG